MCDDNLQSSTDLVFRHPEIAADTGRAEHVWRPFTDKGRDAGNLVLHDGSSLVEATTTLIGRTLRGAEHLPR